MRAVYNTLIFPLRLVAELWAACHGSGSPSGVWWTQSLGRDLPPVVPGGVWLHGASVGEVKLITLLSEAIRRIAPDLQLATSARTVSGRALLPDLSPSTAAFYAPLDFPYVIRRFLDTVRPSLVILAETEIWPNLVHEIQLRGIPVMVLNARLSRKRMGKYLKYGALYRPLMEGLAMVGAQSDADAVRYRQLGVPENVVNVTGNIKYDLPLPSGDIRSLRARFGLADTRPVIVAGSTGAGEEALVAEAFLQVLGEFPETLLILAPRHLERLDEVERLVRATELLPVRLSETDPGSLREANVLLVDTMGELSQLYCLAWAAFVGGSLVPVGGHNLLEPAALGIPVLFGPHVDNVADPAAVLVRSGAGRCVKNVTELASVLRHLIEDRAARDQMGARALGVLEENRGALQNTMHLLGPFLDGSQSNTTRISG